MSLIIDRLIDEYSQIVILRYIKLESSFNFRCINSIAS